MLDAEQLLDEDSEVMVAAHQQVCGLLDGNIQFLHLEILFSLHHHKQLIRQDFVPLQLEQHPLVTLLGRNHRTIYRHSLHLALHRVKRAVELDTFFQFERLHCDVWLHHASIFGQGAQIVYSAGKQIRTGLCDSEERIRFVFLAKVPRGAGLLRREHVSIGLCLRR